jgi:hypothetical protein
MPEATGMPEATAGVSLRISPIALILGTPPV